MSVALPTQPWPGTVERGAHAPHDAVPGPDRVRGGIRRGTDRDRGAVTAETAVAVPSLVVSLMILVWIILAVTAQLRVVEQLQHLRQAARVEGLHAAGVHGEGAG